MTTYPAARASYSALRALILTAAAAAVAASAGCAGDTGLQAPEEADAQVEIEVKGSVTDEFGNPLYKASICSLYAPTASCAVTAEDGSYSMSALIAPSLDNAGSPMIAFLVDAEGYYPAVHPRRVSVLGERVEPMRAAFRMVPDTRMAKQAAILDTEFSSDMAQIAIEITRSESESSARAWKGLRVATDSPQTERAYYVNNDRDVDPNLKRTTDNGGVLIPNVEPGVLDITIAGESAPVRCAMVDGFGSADANRFHVDAVPGRVTVLRAVCYQLDHRPHALEPGVAALPQQVVGPEFTDATHPGDGPRFGPAVRRVQDLPGMTWPPHGPHPR